MSSFEPRRDAITKHLGNAKPTWTTGLTRILIVVSIVLGFILIFSIDSIAQELPDGVIARFGSTAIIPDTERPDAIFSVSFSKDGKTLVSGSEWGFIRFWDVEKARLKQTLYGFGHNVKSFTILQMERYVGKCKWVGWKN